MREKNMGQPRQSEVVRAVASDRIRLVIGSDRVPMHENTHRPTKAVMRALREAAKRGAIV